MNASEVVLNGVDVMVTKDRGEGVRGRRGERRLLSVAPMMDWTDRHYRYMLRLISKKALLYTEMVTSAAIVLGPHERLLRYDPIEHPIALQLGGSDPAQLAEAAKIGEDWGYDEINLNVGCPSDRVQQGTFGACLMAQPALVAEIVAALREAVSIPVTVKHRIGIDGLEAYEDLERFVSIVKEAGCDRFIVHARIAILGGLSPKENRSIPPLRYEDVYRLKRRFPELWIEGNGQIRSLEEAKEKLMELDGVMLGRAAYENPFLFARADHEIFGEPWVGLTRREVVEGMIPYIEAEVAAGVSLTCITRHMQGLFYGESGARHWRRTLSTEARCSEGDIKGLFERAMARLF